MKDIRSLENFIIATMLAEGKIVQTKTGREVHFPFQIRKTELLISYLTKNNLTQHVTLNMNNESGIIRQSIILEKILKDWSNKVEITAINPKKYNLKILTLSICLYAQKSKHGVILNTNLKEELQDTITSLTNLTLPITLRSYKDSFYMKPFFPFLLEAIKFKVTLLETAELNYLLPDKEKVLFKQKMLKESGEIYANAWKH